jgi:uncharacterized membrane protein required for colicin V production
VGSGRTSAGACGPDRTAPHPTRHDRSGLAQEAQFPLPRLAGRCYPCAAPLPTQAGSADHGGKRVNLGEFLGGIGTVDLLIVLYLIGFFVLGFAQGTIRRLIGIFSILFSFLFAANLAGPLGQFLGDNWSQFPRPYSYMIGFGTIFMASAIALALVVQSYYKPQQLFQKARFADEVLGGFLGLLQALIVFGAVLIILDSFFRIPGVPAGPQELPFLRDFWGGLDHTQFAVLFRNTLIPSTFALIGLFIPDTIKALYPLR